MPVKSLNSVVLKWPDASVVLAALKSWTLAESERHPELVGLGYFGSYARGDWGVGSDLDLLAIVRRSPLPFERRGCQWSVETLPVPAEILVYTESEWESIQTSDSRFSQVIHREAIWIFP
jgi:hypothetical protein